MAWTGGQTGDVVTVQGSDSTRLAFFTCSWDATAGQATIPHTVLAVVAGQTGGELVWAQDSQITFDAGSYSVSGVSSLFGAASADFQ